MKNALKCVFGLLDLVKIRENGTTFPETGQYMKKCPYDDHTLSLSLCQSVRECPKFLKIIQETNFDMGFQKINIRDRYKKVVVFNGCVSQTVIFE